MARSHEIKPLHACKVQTSFRSPLKKETFLNTQPFSLGGNYSFQPINSLR